MTLWRVAIALTACLALSGCYLASEKPRFDDAAAVAILGDKTLSFAHFERDGPVWKPSDMGLIIMIPEGNHYRLHDPTIPEGTDADPMVHFVGLDDTHWLMQFTVPEAEAVQSTYYGVASWDGVALLITAIACDDLRDRPGIAAQVTFSDDDCSLPPSSPGQKADFPALLWQDLPPADIKLELRP